MHRALPDGSDQVGGWSACVCGFFFVSIYLKRNGVSFASV
jgi:hypothetical protein